MSRIAEKIVGKPLRISGRITQRGTVADNVGKSGAHSIIYQQGNVNNADETIDNDALKFGTNDLIIIGANAIDLFNNAAILAGSLGGGLVGKSINLWNVEGVKVIVAVGLEKLIPGNINEIVKRTNRKNKFLLWGMAVGLIPIQGEIFTEIEAIKMLANVDCFTIAAGGIV
ncbi:MAG: hypothetical protein SCL54_11160 [Bacillota bacterium]|nr:hypothetical protein [Bacillota bacterium]